VTAAVSFLRRVKPLICSGFWCWCWVRSPTFEEVVVLKEKIYRFIGRPSRAYHTVRARSENITLLKIYQILKIYRKKILHREIPPTQSRARNWEDDG
jgi:hypothetical protein